MPIIVGDGDPFPKSVKFGDGDHFPSGRGDEDPFPLHHKALADGGTEEWKLGTADYMAEQLGDFVILHATGTTTNSAITPHLVMSIPVDPKDKSDPSFALYFQQQGIGNAVLKDFDLHGTFIAKNRRVPFVIVYDAKGKHEVKVHNWFDD
jgi:hypothetical protein